MRNYKLEISDYRYSKEIPVLYGTMLVTIILIALMFMLYLPLGIGFLLSIILLFVNLYSEQIKMLGACVKVSETQFPQIYRMAQTAADRLDINLPPVYITQSPIINAFATGFFGNYYVVIHSATVEACTDDELLMIVGHEFSHIKGNHVMLTALMNMGVGNGMKLFPGLSWLQLVMQFVFLYLSRCFEYTCDRGGLIACGDVKSVVTCQTKLAVGKELFKTINIMEFYKQALELDKKAFGFMAEVEATHPLTVHRIREAVRFYRSNAYRRIAAMQGKSGTSTLQGSVATGDLMEKIINKPEKKQTQSSQNSTQYDNVNNLTVQKKSLELCKNCGSPRKNNAPFCTACGAKFEAAKINIPPVLNLEDDAIPITDSENECKFCTNCGAKNLKHADFCTECGNKF